jgi:predicted O-methyltransferase YrrM
MMATEARSPIVRTLRSFLRPMIAPAVFAVLSFTRRVRWYRKRLPTTTLEHLTGRPPSKLLASPLLDDICMPPYVGAPHDDFNALLAIADWVGPTTILELGTAHGNTIANLCQRFPLARAITVNAPAEEQTGHIITYTLRSEDIGRVYRKYNFGDRVTQLYCNTLDLDLRSTIRDPVVDLAVVDACHDTEYVVNDFYKVEPFVRRGGVVLFHDTHPSMYGHLHGSYRACMLLRQERYDVRHIDGTWWGVWVKP